MNTDMLDLQVPVRRQRPKIARCYLPRSTEKPVAGHVQAGEILAFIEDAPPEWRRIASDEVYAAVQEQTAAALTGQNVGITRGGRALEATAPGVPYLEGGRLHVLPVHVAHHPRHSLDVAGDLLVVGDVGPDVEIRAEGDILIDGSVHGARIEAGGDVEVLGIVRLHARVHAGGRISVLAAEMSALRAEGAIRVAADALFCRMEATGGIEITGRMLGGHAAAGTGISAAAIGSPKGTTTRIILVPHDAPLPELRAAESRLNHCKERLRRLLAGESGEEAERRLLEEVRKSLKELLLARRRSAMRPIPQVEVVQAIHAGVTLSAGSARLVVDRMLPPCRIYPSGGQFQVIRDPAPDLLAV